MKLWLITRTNGAHNEAQGFVVRAESEQVARTIANRFSGGEGTIWEDVAHVTCAELTAPGESGLILRDYWND